MNQLLIRFLTSLALLINFGQQLAKRFQNVVHLTTTFFVTIAIIVLASVLFKETGLLVSLTLLTLVVVAMDMFSKHGEVWKEKVEDKLQEKKDQQNDNH